MKKHHKDNYWLIIIIFILAFIIRFISVFPNNTIIGFDQARDLFDSTQIVNGNLRIIGPTAGNNPNLHHGVLWLYFMIPPLLISHNPMTVVIWNILFNALSVIVIYLLAKDLFNSKKIGLIAGVITAVSYYYVSFSGWLSNPTVTLLTVPLFFLGLWKYYQKKNWGLILSTISLGLSIQFELFFIYLIPLFVILWFLLRLRFPNLKTFVLSTSALLLTLSTMIATEIKFNFQGVMSILGAGKLVGETHTSFFNLLKDFLITRWEVFYQNFWPQNKDFGLIFGLFVTFFFIFEIIKNIKVKNTKNKDNNDCNELIKRNLFLLLWLFSPIIMLILGTHNAPWFLIGRQGAAVIMGAYLISKLRYNLLIIPTVIFVICTNLFMVKGNFGSGQKLLEPDKSAILSKQVKVMEYTYKISNGEPFAIDTVTNPLYINALWAWNYDWYGKSCSNNTPTWLGGDQLVPYNSLSKATGKEKYFFLIIDETSRIPPIYKENAVKSIKKIGKLIEEKSFNGITVMTFVK